MSIIYESSAAACSLLRGRGMANMISNNDVDRLDFRSEKILLSVDMTDDDVMMRHWPLLQTQQNCTEAPWPTTMSKSMLW